MGLALNRSKLLVRNSRAWWNTFEIGVYLVQVAVARRTGMRAVLNWHKFMLHNGRARIDMVSLRRKRKANFTGDLGKACLEGCYVSFRWKNEQPPMFSCCVLLNLFESLAYMRGPA